MVRFARGCHSSSVRPGPGPERERVGLRRQRPDVEPVQAHDLAGGVEHARELLAEGERLLEGGGEPVELLHVPGEALQLPALLVDLAKQPGVLDGEHRLGREGLERGDDLGREGAPLAPQDHEAAQEPLLADERDREEEWVPSRMCNVPDLR